MPNDPRLAIHAHPDDGMVVATNIRKELNALDVRMWGEDSTGWLGNLAQLDYLIVVGSTAGLNSPEFMRVWHSAYVEGIAIFLLPLPGFSMKRLPAWAQRAYAYPTTSDELNKTARLLRNSYPRIRILSEAPSLPVDYLERTALLAQAKRRMTDSARVCLYGTPGSGRTLLAAALCRDPQISDSAQNGTIWIEAGARRTALELLTTLYQRLTASKTAFSEEQDAVAALNTRLRGKPVLIVLEDIFDWSQVMPFLSLVDRVQLVVTSSRPFKALPSLKMIGMDRDEAVRFLSGGYPEQFDQAGRVIDQMGSLPGDLYLLKQVLVLLEQDWTRLESLLQEYADPILLVLSCFSDIERARYRSLSVFVEGVTVPLTSIDALWGTKAEPLCRRFETAGLLTLNAEGVRPRYWFPVDIEDHRRLLAGWGDPFTLPDPYAWNNYPYHQQLAGQDPMILLRDLGWMRTRLGQTESAVILKDYAHPELIALHRAWKEALPQIVHEPRQWLTTLAAHAGDQIGAIKAQVDAIENEHWLAPVGTVSQQIPSALRSTLKGHNDFVGGLVMLSNGKTLVSASEDGTMRVWDTERGLCLHTLEEHTAAINHLALASDGRWLASASDDYLIMLWDTETWKVQRIFRGHTSFVSRVAFTPDGTRLLSVSRDHTVRVWDVYSESEIACFKGHREWVISLAISPDGHYAATASINNVLLLWDLVHLQLLKPLTDFSENFISNLDFPEFSAWLFTHSPNTSGHGHRDYPHDLKFLPDGRLVSADESVKVWSIPDGAELLTLEVGGMGVQRILLTGDGKRLITAAGRSISVWEMESGQNLKTFAEHTDDVTSLALSPDEKRLISGAKDRTIRIWDLTQDILPAVAHIGSIANLIRADNQLISSGHDGIVKVWDIPTGELQHALGRHAGRFVAIGASNARLVTAAHESERSDYQLWDLKTGQNLESRTGVKYEWVDKVAVTSDGRCAILGKIDGDTLLQWSLDPLQDRQPFEEVIQQVIGLALSPDNTLIAVTTYKNRVLRVYRLEDRQVVFSTEQPEPIHYPSVCFSPDQRWLVAGTNSGSMECFQLPTFELCHTILTPYRYVAGLTFMDAQHLVTYSADGYVRIWDVAEGRLLTTIDAHDDVIRRVQVAGKRILSLSTFEAKVWQINNGEFELLARYISADKLYYCVFDEQGTRFAVGGESGQIRIFEIRGGVGQ